MLLRTKGGISRTERLALKELADALIFNEPLECEFIAENIPLIAQKLKQEMIELDTASQRTMQLSTEDLFNKIPGLRSDRTQEVLDKTDLQLNVFLKEIQEMSGISDKSFVIGFTGSYATPCVFREHLKYNKWGFTPKLANFVHSDDDYFFKDVAVRKNCLGTTLGLGSYLAKRGIRFDLAITADHPYVVAYLEKETYFVGFGLHKLHNTIVQHDGYKTYRPHPKDKLPHSFVIIHDFDRCALYEILENMAMLALVAKGVDATRLPNTFKHAAEITNIHAETLLKADWKALATKLFPEITRSLVENAEDWHHEFEQILSTRKRQYVEHVYFMAAEKAYKETMFAHSSFKMAHAMLMHEFVMHPSEIVAHVRHGTPFPDAWWRSDNIVRYFKVINEHLDKESPEIRELCAGMLEKKFIQVTQINNTQRNEKSISKHVGIFVSLKERQSRSIARKTKNRTKTKYAGAGPKAIHSVPSGRQQPL